MINQNVIIIGASGHGKVVIDIIEKEEKFVILGLLDDNLYLGKEFSGYPILGTIQNLPDIISDINDFKIIIAIGDNWIRYQVKEKIIKIIPDIIFASAIHPSAQIAKNVTIGIGVVIMAGVIINSDSTIGDFTILNTKSSIDHDSEMLIFSSLGPNATTGGNTIIGEFSAIAISATISHGIRVGNHSLLGACSFLNEDCDNYSVMIGIPAKKIRNRIAGEKYL